ncbi:MAG: lytic murein transglycosylase [Thermodesulfobacteriota bacterium]
MISAAKTKLFLTLTAAVFLWLIIGATAVQAEVDPFFKPLLERLVVSGFERSWLESLFLQPCVKLEPKALVLRATVREAKINYGQFLEPDNLNLARSFLSSQAVILNQAREKHKVPAEIIVAILLLETKVGTQTGKLLALNTLASQTMALHPEVAAEVLKAMPEEERRRFTKESLVAWLGQSNSWFFGELKALLVYFKENGQDPCRVYGSYTGAIGLCQFQPSNLKAYGQDGNQDGRVDLFQAEDAVMSAAYYLNRSGWRDGLNEDRRIAVVKRYNNSLPYARTVLEVARRLKTP